MIARISIERPTESQLVLMAEASRAAEIEQLMRAPIDADFIPAGQIDERRLRKIQRRLADEAAVHHAAIFTELVRQGATKLMEGS